MQQLTRVCMSTFLLFLLCPWHNLLQKQCGRVLAATWWWELVTTVWKLSLDHSFSHLCSFFRSQILFDQAQRSIKQQLHTFIKEWVSSQRWHKYIDISWCGISTSSNSTFFPGIFANSRTLRSSLTACVKKWSWLRWRMPRHRETRSTRQKRPRRPWSWAAKPSDTWRWTMFYRWNTCSFLLKYSDGAADRQQQQLSWAQFYSTFFGNITRQYQQ